jgi:hypothetical protein
MAKRPLVHCRICKGEIDRDNQHDWIMPQEKWYYHSACYEDFGKKKGAIKEGDLTIEADDDLWKSAVYDYLKRDVKISLNFTKFQSQWNNFLKKGMTAKGIYFTLRYFYEIEKGDKTKSENGIGIVPHVYERGTCYWGERNLRDKGICARIEAQILQRIEKEKNMKIIFQPPKPRKLPVVDLSIIADMEDEE